MQYPESNRWSGRNLCCPGRDFLQGRYHHGTSTGTGIGTVAGTGTVAWELGAWEGGLIECNYRQPIQHTPYIARDTLNSSICSGCMSMVSSYTSRCWWVLSSLDCLSVISTDRQRNDHSLPTASYNWLCGNYAPPVLFSLIKYRALVNGASKAARWPCRTHGGLGMCPWPGER